jgi:hypothetical protein
VKQESCDSHEDKNIVVGLLKRASNSSNSPPQEGDKGECSRYIFLHVRMEEKVHVHILV